MNKIAKLALEAKGFKNVDAVLEVVNATNQPGAALELLLGIYEDPIIPEKFNVRGVSSICTFVGFDKFATDSNRVKFSYQTRKEFYLYVPEVNKDYLPKTEDIAEFCAINNLIAGNEIKEFTFEGILFSPKRFEGCCTYSKCFRIGDYYDQKSSCGINDITEIK